MSDENSATPLEVPVKVDIPQRLYNDLQLLIAYGLESDEEAGGLLIIAQHGNLGVVAEQLGKDREIVLEPNEDLHKGEKYVGTCVPSKTIILGDNKPIEMMKPNDMVFGATGHNAVIHSMRRGYSGDLVRIKGCGLLPFETTPEHPILVVEGSNRHKNHVLKFGKPIWKQAKYLVPRTIKGGDFLVIPRLRGSDETAELDLTPFIKGNPWSVKRTSIPLTEKFAWVLGLYVAEGSCRGDREGLGFALNKDETELSKKISDALGSPIKVKRRGRNGIVVECYNPLLGRAFRAWCGHNAHEKHIPDFILNNKNEKILRAFLEGYETGDGWKNDVGISIETVSPILVQQYQLAWARLGINVSIYKRDRSNRKFSIEGRTISGGISYTAFRYLVVQKCSRCKITEDAVLVPIRKKTFVPYSGEVYNIETTDSTYLVSNVVVHNCHVHPVTNQGSTGDFDGYLKDENEKVMLVMGADKSINVYIKTPLTVMNPTEEPIIKNNFEQEDLLEVAESFGILYYRATAEDKTVLTLLNKKLGGQELEPLNETWPIEHLIKALGIKGLDELPDAWSSKKWPKKNMLKPEEE